MSFIVLHDVTENEVVVVNTDHIVAFGPHVTGELAKGQPCTRLWLRGVAPYITGAPAIPAAARLDVSESVLAVCITIEVAQHDPNLGLAARYHDASGA